MARARWSSNFVFIFAAVGSAVGLGNVWRFPYLAGKYGGGAFLVPYIIVLVALGIPLLIMEFAIGQRMQLGAVGSFKKIQNSLGGIGLGAVLSGFVIVGYYAVVIAWCINYFFQSFTMAWGTDTKDFFFNQVLHISSGAGEVGFIVPSIIFGLVLAWILVYFSVWKGVRSVGIAAMITMPVPLVLILILLIRGVTLPGAIDGILYYIRPDFTALLDHELWSAALSQIFFTLSLAFGVMIAYASYQHESSDIAKSAIITSVVNSSVSIISGFAVFSTLGYMSMKSGTPVAELAAGGPSLAFIVFPQAISMMPFAKVFAVIFFLILINLAINSAFSLVEAVSTIISDHMPNIRKELISLYVCIFGFISGIIYTSHGGLYYLDIVDHFITTYGLVIFGLLEAIAVGWLYDIEDLRAYINQVSDIQIGRWWSNTIKYVIPVCLITLLGYSLFNDLSKPYEGYPQWALFAFGWCMLLMVGLASYIFSHYSKQNA